VESKKQTKARRADAGRRAPRILFSAPRAAAGGHGLRFVGRDHGGGMPVEIILSMSVLQKI
jgi:hypothetical protein